VEKLELYDILGILVPGVLLVYVFLLCFPGTTALVPPKMSDALNTIAFTAMSIFVGQLIQAIASVLEGPLYRTWGGRPSERALHSGLGPRYLPEATAPRIRAKLKAVAGEHATDRDLFIYAMQRAEGRAAESRGSGYKCLILLTIGTGCSSFWRKNIGVVKDHIKCD
jgi:hypothetical protein